MLVRKFRGFSPSLVAGASAASFSILPSSCVKAVDVVEMRKNVIDFLDNFLVGKNYVSFKEESSGNKVYSFSIPSFEKVADKFNFFKIVVKEREVECHFVFNNEEADQCCKLQDDVFKRIPLDREDASKLLENLVIRIEKIHKIYDRIRVLWDEGSVVSNFPLGVGVKTGNFYLDFANSCSDFNGVGAYIGMKLGMEHGPVQLRKIRVCNNGKQIALVYGKEGVDELDKFKVREFVKQFYYIESEDDLDSLYDAFFGENYKGWETQEIEDVSYLSCEGEDEVEKPN